MIITAIVVTGIVFTMIGAAIGYVLGYIEAENFYKIKHQKDHDQAQMDQHRPADDEVDGRQTANPHHRQEAAAHRRCRDAEGIHNRTVVGHSIDLHRSIYLRDRTEHQSILEIPPFMAQLWLGARKKGARS